MTCPVNGKWIMKPLKEPSCTVRVLSGLTRNCSNPITNSQLLYWKSSRILTTGPLTHDFDFYYAVTGGDEYRTSTVLVKMTN